MNTGKHVEITRKIVQAFFTVYNSLGYGFSEKVYQNAMELEMERLGLRIETQKRLEVYYSGNLVGEYFVDFIVENVVIVELKAVRQIAQEHEAQLLNFLKASEMEVGLLLNFGATAEIKRKVYDNERKGTLNWINAAGSVIGQRT
jgi:GxxExxY protein